MLQVARLAPKLLGDSSQLVADFLLSQIQDDGGFQDRDGQSDLYYTVFGIAGLIALQVEPPLARLEKYLQSFGEGAGLDSVHLSCLARAWAGMSAEARAAAPADKILARLEAFRTPDGGYHIAANAQQGTVYGCFMALGAYQDLGRQPPQAERMLDCIAQLKAQDGGYANGPEMPIGLTPPSAAVAALQRQLGGTVDAELGPWLRSRCHPGGGFFAVEAAPVPDLLSTATALHALQAMHVDFSDLVEPCLDFVDSLWTARGGFYGSWEDDDLDCEYTYYGLLALGHLSL